MRCYSAADSGCNRSSVTVHFVVMPLVSGTRLAHYEILEPIGTGGMGEVYRAKDEKLGREVAIKVLPGEFREDEERLKRFQREAKVLASLNHPNIAAIYGVEQTDATHFLVLELVEGETLAERISRGPIQMDESLEIGRRVAEALEEAHEQGVVHRDLKPANIKITPRDEIKVLDFGLAKAFGEEAHESDSSMSPTLTRDATGVGVIMGTAAYMSPEQARGRPVDKRTDIFAFGAVLYEMLTGRKAFPGDDVSDVLAAVIKLEPDWTDLPRELPPPLLALLRRCLEKDPRKRRRDIGDVWYELQNSEVLKTNTESPRSSQWRFVLAGAAVVGVIVAAAAWINRSPSGIPQKVVRFDFDATPIGAAAGQVLAISPMGLVSFIQVLEGASLFEISVIWKNV